MQSLNDDRLASPLAPDAVESPAPEELGEDVRRGWMASVTSAVTGAIGTVMGLVPHVLHHVNLIAGAALVTGAVGNAVFGVLGLVLSIPLLRRLYRRFGTWKAPAIATAVFAGMFSISAFVVGPAISGTDEPSPPPMPATSPAEHEKHH